MEIFNLVVAPFFAVIGILFLIIGLQRGFRKGFPYNIFNQTEKEIFRDQFLASFDLFCAMFCAVPIFAPIRIWHMAIPLGILFVFLGAFGVPIRMYLSALIATGMAKMVNRNSRFFDEISSATNLKWYELTPFAFIAGWIVYYLMYLGIAWLAGFEPASDKAPLWSIVIAFAVGAICATIATISFYQTLKNVQ